MTKRPAFRTLPIKQGRRAWRKDPQLKVNALARRTMLRFFSERAGFSTPVAKVCMYIAPRLRSLIARPNMSGEIKNQKFQAMLNRYAQATQQEAI
jgi:hypothetical protein